MTATAIGTYATTALVKAYIGTTDGDDDALLGVICDRVNQVIEDMTGRVLAPISSAAYLYDGDGSKSIYLPTPAEGPPIGGIRAVTLVETQLYTGAGYTTLASTDYFLRQKVMMTGPYERLVFSDVPRGGMFGYWPKGYGTVRVTGTAGWTAIPDTITDLALNVAARAWNARSIGNQDVGGSDEMGRPIVARYMSGQDKDLLRRYTLPEKLA